MLRASLLAAVKGSPNGYLTDSDLAQEVFKARWVLLLMAVGLLRQSQRSKALAEKRKRPREIYCLIVSISTCVRAGGFNNPNLEQLGLLGNRNMKVWPNSATMKRSGRASLAELEKRLTAARFRVLKAVLDTVVEGSA